MIISSEAEITFDPSEELFNESKIQVVAQKGK